MFETLYTIILPKSCVAHLKFQVLCFWFLISPTSAKSSRLGRTHKPTEWVSLAKMSWCGLEADGRKREEVSWGLCGLMMRPKTLCATRWRSIERRKSRMAIPGCQSATCIIGTRWRQSGTSMIHYRWIISSPWFCMRRNWTPLIDEKSERII